MKARGRRKSARVDLGLSRRPVCFGESVSCFVERLPIGDQLVFRPRGAALGGLRCLCRFVHSGLELGERLAVLHLGTALECADLSLQHVLLAVETLQCGLRLGDGDLVLLEVACCAFAAVERLLVFLRGVDDVVGDVPGHSPRVDAVAVEEEIDLLLRLDELPEVLLVLLELVEVFGETSDELFVDRRQAVGQDLLESLDAEVLAQLGPAQDD